MENCLQHAEAFSYLQINHRIPIFFESPSRRETLQSRRPIAPERSSSTSSNGLSGSCVGEQTCRAIGDLVRPITLGLLCLIFPSRVQLLGPPYDPMAAAPAQAFQMAVVDQQKQRHQGDILRLQCSSSPERRHKKTAAEADKYTVTASAV